MELPTGTVTFLFTDIEGSTKLLQELGDAYGAVQDDHMRLMREAIAAGGGTELRTEGDAFFAVFPSAGGAVQAAVAPASLPCACVVARAIHSGADGDAHRRRPPRRRRLPRDRCQPGRSHCRGGPRGSGRAVRAHHVACGTRTPRRSFPPRPRRAPPQGPHPS